jgi:hypothetical protein
VRAISRVCMSDGDGSGARKGAIGGGILLRAYLDAAWARGAVGSATDWQSVGQGFESPRVHQKLSARLSIFAVGVMQVMPSTAAVDGPKLLNRDVNLYDPRDNIDLGTAIIKHNLDAYHDDLAKALCAYYAGEGAVTEWATMRADCRHYVWAVYNAAIMFRDGRGPA